jgi:hypothetical protein
MKQGDRETWCAWHERWEMTFRCHWCGLLLPECYGGAHLRYACTEYPVTA